MAQMSDHYFGLTDPGRVRDNNEDAFLVQEYADKARILACVIDGVGGYEGGEVAAAIARDNIAELLKDTPATDVPAALREALYIANQKIIEEKHAHPGSEQMACVLTLAMADIDQNLFHYAHVGDTRLYLLRGQSLVKVTKDHSFVGFLEDSSRITEADAMRHPKRNEVNKALGFDPSIRAQQDYIETGSSPFLPGDLLLLCSDGLTDMIGGDDITSILSRQGSLAEKARALIDAANAAGGRDNITVVLVHHFRARLSQEPTLPSPRKLAEETPEMKRAEEREYRRRGTSPMVWVLLLLCIGLGAALAWQLNKEPEPAASQTQAPAIIPAAPATPVRNASEQRLLDSLNSGQSRLALDSNAFRAPVVITDSMVIRRDSLHLSGNGLVLKGDSARRCPAFVLPAGTKYVFLENMVFEDFPVAISAHSQALRLRNVRFRNCGVPVLYAMHVPDSAAVSGLIHQGLFSGSDSSRSKSKLWP